ncbi:hypothetical protein EHS25_005490 [Saitozyma podzolica]|uniref:N-acetyltransferase domain-containing protein n=1 Tax=Saitozyma podzolica TaxID=1890683 RepID=A0A427XYT4_9TREE|nr:hypothetical protein EHS25_005490 [Saitozyma podzolica]
MAASVGAQRPRFRVKVAASQDEWEACLDVRMEVFVVEQGFSADDEVDQYDPISRNFLLVVESPSPPDTATSSLTPVEGGTTSKPVGTVRLTPSLGKVSRLAVLSDYRVYGFGRELMRAAMDYARTLQDDELTKVVRSREDGATVVPLKLHSQLQVIPWYQKLGFKPEGELFDEDGAPHQKMVCEVEVVSSA